ncbi:MAG: glycosyltransferase family 4 protein [Flavobacteriaceae bacterium]|nr:glycosyltransferase family 4 protein [Flavobacteriaceae bacterium]
MFQIIHHITFVNDWFPSLFILLKNKENFFIWGPIGSNNPIDNKFIYLKKHQKAEKRKTIFLSIIRRLDVFFWMCKKKSNIIIGTSENVKNTVRIQDGYLHKFSYMPAIAIRKELLNNYEGKDLSKKEFKIITAGQLRYIKNFRLAIKSFSIFLKFLSKKERDLIQLQIVGDGEQKEELINYVKELKIEGNVDFKGQIKQSELMNCFKESHLFLFPTLENAGFVILEAMTNGLPIIALDYGGPKQFVKENQKLQLVSEKDNIQEIETNLAKKISFFYNNKKMINKVGKDNFDIIKNNFTWEQKTMNFIRIYNTLNVKGY